MSGGKLELGLQLSQGTRLTCMVHTHSHKCKIPTIEEVWAAHRGRRLVTERRSAWRRYCATCSCQLAAVSAKRTQLEQ